MPLPQPSAEAIDHFIDALWLEDGLAPLTLAAYRRDLTLFAAWLQDQQGKPLDGSGQTDLLTVLRAGEQRLQLEASALDAERDFHLARIRYEAATAQHAPAPNP